MKKQKLMVLAVVLALLVPLVSSNPSLAGPPNPGIERLKQDAAGEVEITWATESGRPSFVRGRVPLQPMVLAQGVDSATVARAFIGRYADAFGITNLSNELQVAQSEMDALGMTHVTLRQVYQGVEVYGAQMKVHLSVNGEEVVALSNGFVPGIALPTVDPQVSADQALNTAKMALPDGDLAAGPELTVYPGVGSNLSGSSACLAWLVELRNDSIPARNIYVIDAVEGDILDVLDRLFSERIQQAFDAGNSARPIASFVSPENQDPTSHGVAQPGLDGDTDAQENGSQNEMVILSDGQFVFGPNVEGFDLELYLNENAPHLLPIYDDLFFRAVYASINPKVILTLIEMRTGLVSDTAADESQVQNPFGMTTVGVSAQLKEVTGILSEWYYYHLLEITPLPIAQRDVHQLGPTDSSSVTLPPETNAATFAVAKALAVVGDSSLVKADSLITALDNSQASGFFQTYLRLFPGDDPLDATNVINLSESPPSDIFQFPFLVGEDWSFNGVHGWGGSSPDMSSIDFVRGEWHLSWGEDVSNTWVVAAAAGKATRRAQCWLEVEHSDGWKTNYYHLENPQVDTGDFVTHNQRLANYANTKAEANCLNPDDYNPGAHLHFSLRHNGAYVPISGTLLSGWTVYAGSSAYSSDTYMERDGQKVCAYSGQTAPCSADSSKVVTNTGVTDTISPTVTIVNSNADTGDGRLSEDEITSAKITQLNVTFSERVQDLLNDASWIHDVTTTTNYLLATNGDDDTFQTTECGTVLGDDTQITIDSAEYISKTQTVTLTVNGGNALPSDSYRLIVCSSTMTQGNSIQDLAGNPLDGNQDGTGGDDFVLNFQVCGLGQYLVQYYNNRDLSGDPAFSRCESAPIDYGWGFNRPDDRLGYDDFSVRWVGRFGFSDDDYHTFSACSDDGVRVWVDDHLVIDGWGDHAPTDYHGALDLSPGEHQVKVEYYEHDWWAEIQMDWHSGRNRETYNANHATSLPGTLARSEGEGPTGDQDVDNAHNFAGDTHDYYYNTHDRRSYDDQGATIVSTVHYGRNYNNAFWNGSQMVYGDGFPVKDVVAHELTHAVTEHSAELEYRWQSGALNESFSDIFGAMVDRDDWLMGEDLPPDALAGREAIRDLSDPSRFGQPDHTDDWRETCSDNEGVHTNSGITNKAYYNIASAIGKDKAEHIFYRVLTVYLDTSSSLEDARAAALQATWELSSTLGYTATYTTVYTAVRDGFNAVGLDGVWNPPSNDCSCAASTALSDEEVYPDRASALQVMSTLYRVRDRLLSNTPAGRHYRTLYEQYTGRINALLLRDTQLRASGGQILQMVTPGLDKLMGGNGGQEVVTQEMVTEVTSYLQSLVDEAWADGDEELAQTIEQEMARIDWDHLVDMTFEEAWDYINSQISIHPYTVYLPLILR